MSLVLSIYNGAWIKIRAIASKKPLTVLWFRIWFMVTSNFVNNKFIFQFFNCEINKLIKTFQFRWGITGGSNSQIWINTIGYRWSEYYQETARNWKHEQWRKWSRKCQLRLSPNHRLFCTILQIVNYSKHVSQVISNVQ